MKEKITWATSIVKSGYSLKDKLILAIYFIFWPLRRIFIKNMKLITKITVKNSDGIFYCDDDFSAVGCVHPSYEKEFRDIFKNMKKGIFIDVGANVGKYSIMVGKNIKGKVIAIEPEPKNFEILKKNIELNNLNNVIVINKGCFFKKDILTFYLDKIGTGGHSLVKENIGDKKIEIEVDTLDNILSELKIKKVDLIKIDVEGAETEVLKGAVKILKEFHPKILIEAWNKVTLKKIKKILIPLKYKGKRLNKENYLFNKEL